MNQFLFNNFNIQIEIANLISFIVFSILGYLFYYYIKNSLVKKYLIKYTLKKQLPSKIFNILLLLLFIYILILFFTFILYEEKISVFSGTNLTIKSFLETIYLAIFSYLVYYLSSILFIEYFYSSKSNENSNNLEAIKNKNEEFNKIIQLIFFSLFAIYFAKAFFPSENLPIFLQYSNNPDKLISWGQIFSSVFIFSIARLMYWLITEVILHRYFSRQRIAIGAQYAIKQLLKYIIYIIISFTIISNLGIKITALWGGAAALLVGVGLSLQKTFSDFFSGLILLFERTIDVGDILEIKEHVGIVKKIGIRTSLIETRDKISLIVPNSQLINESVQNWSHLDPKGRFYVEVRIAYGSDTELVKKLLLQAVEGRSSVLIKPKPYVWFEDFAKYSLILRLYFFSENILYIQKIQSEIRFEIDKLFRENGIKIPFPQQEIYVNYPPSDV